LYQFEVNAEKTYEVILSLKDADKGIEREIPFHFVVERPDIVGNLTLTPDTGYEPLKVVLDASKTTLNIPDDEIIYFSWDFGDGERKEKLTNGVISHVYRFDGEHSNGEYVPKVTVQTRKGLTATFSAIQSILVKRQLIQMAISSSSHPTQVAKVGDIVKFSAEFNGLPDTMIWNFGDGSDPVQCKGRMCVETSHMYALPGSYVVNVVLEFEDMQTVETAIEMKIN
jgi:PKD repeat protein